MKTYLTLYNTTAFCCWLVFGLLMTANGGRLDERSLMWLNVAQVMALFEIMHAAFRWVRSPLMSTAAQVFSRLLVLGVIYFLFYRAMFNALATAGIMIVSVAWTVTELVRYSYYAMLINGREPHALKWMRYSFCVALYPIGVAGEWMVLLAPASFATLRFDAYLLLLSAVLVSYLYYFPVLYRYMWSQRKSRI